MNIPNYSYSQQTADGEKGPGDYTIEQLRMAQDFSLPAVKKVLATIPVQKPDRQVFFRVCPEESYRIQAATLDIRANRETYIVLPEVAEEIQDVIRIQTLYLGVTRQEDIFIFPVTLPGVDGKDNPWNESSREAAERAMTKWVRMSADMAAGCYKIYEALGELPEPVWPDHTFQQILNVAFKNRVIDSLEHPVLQQLRGEL